jgi:outer membrane protein assembly factor BamD (BamD/ComL family)
MSNPIPTPIPIAAPTREVPVASPDRLLSELALIDAARAALDSGDTALALSQLDRHDREFPRGQLAPEALALRVEVHAARHEDAKVRELAARFVARYPDHPQAERMRSRSSGEGAIP